jgi:hypothetical protein
MADISMSVDGATKMILKSQAELLQCMERIEVTLSLMEYHQKMIDVSQGQYATSKTDLAILKVEKQHLTTTIEICKKIRDLNNNIESM